MGAAKQIVFRYNGDPTTEESAIDMDGDKSVPKPGSFIERRGGRWKVVRSTWKEARKSPSQFPFYRVFLANEL